MKKKFFWKKTKGDLPIIFSKILGGILIGKYHHSLLNIYVYISGVRCEPSRTYLFFFLKL